MSIYICDVLHWKRAHKERNDATKVACVFKFSRVFSVWQKYSQNADLLTDQENTEIPGKCVLCFLTVAKHQAPDADHQGSPRTTRHVCLHMLVGLAREHAHKQAINRHGKNSHTQQYRYRDSTATSTNKQAGSNQQEKNSHNNENQCEEQIQQSKLATDTTTTNEIQNAG